jgi:flagellar protein FlgJ
MTIATSLAGLTTAQPTVAAKSSEREKLAGVSKQFEAIFVRQMLSAARKTDFGGDDLFGGNSAIDTFREMQDSQFADIASNTGTLGLAKQIEAHLAKFVDGPSTKAGSDVLKQAETVSAAKS